jgi:hypothetical protein
MLRSHIDRIARLATRGAAVAGLVVGSASVAHAQWWPTGSNRGGNTSNVPQDVPRNAPQNATLLFEWQGRVDREVQFDVGNRGVDVRGIDGDQARGRIRENSGLPRGAGYLVVQRIDGRGNVDVVQQPASTNNGNGRGYGNRYGVVRIRDNQGGADTYRIRVYWRSTDSYGSNNGTYDRNDGTYGRNDGTYGRNDDDRYDDRRRGRRRP